MCIRDREETAIACFRIAQEALNNVVRHAGATAVVFELRFADGALRLSVRDDGRGFDVAAALANAARGQSLGLLSMQERAELAGEMCIRDRFSTSNVSRCSI